MRITAIILFLMCMLSCKSQQKAMQEDDAFTNNTYKIIQIQNDNILKKNPTLRFDRKKNLVSGYTGCNSYSAPFRTNDSVMEVGLARVTRQYCEENMTVERDFLLSLSEIKTYKIEEDQISFFNNNKKILLKAIKIATNE